MSASALLVGACCLYVVTLLVLDVRRRRRAKCRAADAERIHAARLAAMKIVVDGEHTPSRDASRDRTRPGKARRRARRA